MKKIIKQDDGRIRVMTVNDQPSLTRQEFKEEVNVNSIIRKYQKTGMLTHVRNNPGAYMDLTNKPDYEVALQTVIDANNQFNTLPSEIRKKFGNDPGELIAYLSDPRNHDEAVELGLLAKPITQDPVKEIKKPQGSPDDKQSVSPEIKA